MAEMTSKKHIVVVGGSLAGLMNAVPLRRLGHKVTILERSPVPLLHDQGAGVVAQGDTLAWVQKHGISKRTEEDISVLSQWRLYLDRSGSIIDKENSHQRMTSWGMLYNIGREAFDGVRHTPEGSHIQRHDHSNENGGQASYEYGCTVTDIVDLGDQIEVKFHRKRNTESHDEVQESLLGDFLVVADGPSTHLREKLLGPETSRRTYAGYVAFRGTVPESDLSEGARAVFVEKFSFFHGTNPNTQILAYTIPNPGDSLEPGKRLVNWVWYHNVDFDSAEYTELMTDKTGNKHRFTLPTGGHMQSHVWDGQKQRASQRLPPQFSELVVNTKEPFVQAITDLEPPSKLWEAGVLLNGKAVIVGDALAGFRPHTAASTSQAAFDALKLEEVFRGNASWDEYADSVWNYAKRLQAHGVRLGTRSQFGVHPLHSD